MKKQLYTTISPQKEVSRSHLADPNKSFQIKQLQMYQKHGGNNPVVEDYEATPDESKLK